MADNKVLIEFQIVQKGGKISAIAKETDQLTKAQDKAAGSQKKLTKQQDMGYGRQKQGLVQTANSTKNFSKLANTIDGDGGGGTSLVGAYATLAANVFAASAAFNALSRAAEFQQLQQGLEIVGNQSGRTLSVLADNLRDATDGALSLEQASRGAALGVSGGFGAKELTGLAEIAKGASLALGRDLADAFDRLTRGAIKLEPEILDELGIMVRLDDAVEQYAAQLGKSASSLSQLERRQAFMNAILEQGKLKFGDIAKEVDPTPYQKLGATFGDLVRGIFTFVNETLNLNGIISTLADSTTALLGVMILFGSTIASQILPGLANAGIRAAGFAEAALETADASLEAAKAQESLALANVQAFEGGAKKFQLAQKELAVEGKASAARAKALKSLEASERGRARNLKKHHGAARKQKEIELEQIRRQIRLIKELELAEQGQSAARLAASTAQINANFAQEQAELMQGVSSGELGLGAAIAASNANLDNQKKKLDELNKNGKKTGGVLGRLIAINAGLALGFSKVVEALKFVGAAFLRFLPIIGLIVTAVGLGFLAFDKLYNTEKVKAFNKANKNLDKILDGLSEKAEEFNKIQESTASLAQKQIRAFQIVSNSISESNSQLKETVRLQKLANEEGNNPERGSNVFQRFGLEFLGRNPLLGYVAEAEIALGNVADMSDKQLRAAIVEIWDIEASPQFKTFKSLIESGIPALAEDLKNRVDLSTIYFDAEGNKRSAEEVKEVLSAAIDATQKKFGLLGDSVTAFSQELKNAERVGSTFMQKFFPKTSATDIVNQFKSLEKGIDNINKATEEAKMTPEEQIQAVGTALSETGPNIRKLLGSSVKDPIENILRLRGEIARFGDEELHTDEDRAKIKELEAKIDAEILKLGKDGEAVVSSTLEILKDIQKNEVLRKTTLEEIALVQKSVSKATKFTAEATALSLMFDRKKLQFKKDQNDEELRILANSNNITKEQIKQDGLVASLQAKKKELLEADVKEEEILAITLQLAEAKNIQTELELESATRSLKVQEAALNVSLSQIASKQQILDAEIKISEIQAKRDAFEVGRATTSPLKVIEQQVAADEKRLKLVQDKAKIEKALLEAQAEILKAELMVLFKAQDITTMSGLLVQDSIMGMLDGIDKATELSLKAIQRIADETEMTLEDALKDAVQKSFFDSPIDASINTTMTNAAFAQTFTGDPSEQAEKTSFALNMMRDAMQNFADQMESLFGEDGKVISSLARLGQTFAEVALGIRQSFSSIDEQFKNPEGFFGDLTAEESKSLKGLMKFAAVGQAVSGVISGFQQVLSADSERRVASIDQAIAAEKKLDGKSAESIAKIQAMEKKKEAIQRKSFEMNKKMQLANAIISTSAAAAQAYASAPPPFNMVLAAMITALGLAQVAVIRKTKFQGGNTDPAVPSKTSLEIGKRSGAVDVAKQATGGELNYLRGGRTDGTNLGGAGASLPGAAMGRKGYAMGGVVVGERGPEVITPAAPVDVTPNFALGGQGANVNFTINAIDAAGVEDVLMNQRGNIIGMIREAANENGERFLETVDTQAYGGNK